MILHKKDIDGKKLTRKVILKIVGVIEESRGLDRSGFFQDFL